MPEVASRAHLEAMVPTIERALADGRGHAGRRRRHRGHRRARAWPARCWSASPRPRRYALALGKPLYGVNHLAAHVAVDQLEHGPLPEPAIALLVSGGHSSLLLVPDLTADVRPLGATIDDAAGEAFDKVARLLGLPFPGGPHIDRAARDGDPAAIAFPRGQVPARRRPYDFSFSGLKTAVARWVEAARRPASRCRWPTSPPSFQEAVVDVLTRKAVAPAGSTASTPGDRRRRGGQLAAARAGRSSAARRPGSRLRVPRPGLCTDNGAMVAALGRRAGGARRDAVGARTSPPTPALPVTERARRQARRRRCGAAVGASARREQRRAGRCGSPRR